MIFRKEDEPVLNSDDQQNQLNEQVEPNNYIPIIPTVLLNGITGIGTGWSTNIHPHSIHDLIDQIKLRLN